MPSAPGAPLGDAPTPRRHFLVWLAETERICVALLELAADDTTSRLAAETVDALIAAHREAAARREGRTAFRFRAPAGAEHLMAVAAIEVRAGGLPRPDAAPEWGR